MSNNIWDSLASFGKMAPRVEGVILRWFDSVIWLSKILDGLCPALKKTHLLVYSNLY